jgi:hypothetical protein
MGGGNEKYIKTLSENVNRRDHWGYEARGGGKILLNSLRE